MRASACTRTWGTLVCTHTSRRTHWHTHTGSSGPAASAQGHRPPKALPPARLRLAAGSLWGHRGWRAKAGRHPDRLASGTCRGRPTDATTSKPVGTACSSFLSLKQCAYANFKKKIGGNNRKATWKPKTPSVGLGHRVTAARGPGEPSWRLTGSQRAAAETPTLCGPNKEARYQRRTRCNLSRKNQTEAV